MQPFSCARLLRLLAFIIPIAILTGCFGEGDGQPPTLANPVEVFGSDDEFILVFADEFDVDGAPSSEKWSFETGYGDNNDGWGNNEWQLYTDSSDNIRVEDGNLVIEARCDTPPCGVRDGTITSARVNTQDKFEFRYGKIEARIKAPVGKGVWPAFWSLGANFPEVGWPRSGEIDFFELFTGQSNGRTTHFTTHWCDETIQAPETCSFPEGRLFDSRFLELDESVGDDFRVFEAEWNKDRIIGKIDGVTYYNRFVNPETMEEFRREFFLILNLAMGGTLGSNSRPPDGTEAFPQTMLVDYVRVYQREEDISTGDENFVIDFEDDGGPYTFNDFEGGVGFVSANPDMDGNPSAKVARLIKFSGGGGELFAGTTLKTADTFDVPLGSTFTLKAWSASEGPINLLFKLEGAIPAELEITHPGGGMWQDFTLDFSSIASGTYTGITFILNNGTPGTDGGTPDDPDWNLYVDDITLIPGEEDPGGGGGDSNVIDFEPAGGPYVFNDFEGGVGFVTENPVTDGNSSANVAKLLKFSGGANFAGTTLTLPTPWDTADGTTFTAKVWGDRPDLSGVALTFKLEPLEQEVVITHGNTGWEELTFELPAASGTITGITLILDNGVPGAAPTDPPSEDPNWTILIDDITQVPPDDGGGSPDGSGIDFEPAGGPYVFNDFEGGVGFVTENPVMDGNNSSANVAKLLKFAGGATFAGTTLQLPTPWDTADGTTFTAKVWGDRPDLSGVALTFKLEPLEQEVVITHGNTGWEELTFELPAASGTITGITFILDNGVPGATPTDPPSEDPNWTILIDDITQVPPDGGGGGPAGPVTDFEDAGGPYVFSDFEGGMATVIDNPDPSGINTSAKVGQMQKFDGADFAGSTLDLGGAVDFSAGEVYTMKVRALREVPVLFKLEGLDQERTATHSGSGTWEELCFDFSGSTGAAPATAITLIFDLGVVGDAEGDPDNWTFQFDDIQLTTSCPDDPGGGDPVEPLVDFEDDGGPYMFADFAGGVAAVIDNPDATGINMTAKVAEMQKFDGMVFGGSTLDLGGAVDFSGGEAFTMSVRALRMVPVLFKFEGLNQERSADHSGSGTWEELCFDFSGSTGAAPATAITFIFDIENNGAAATDPDNWTFQFDEIQQTASCGSRVVVLADFEANASSYDFGSERGFGGGAASVLANPRESDINTSAQVGKMLKYDGMPSAGATLRLTRPVNVLPNSAITMKVWSPRVVDVLLRLDGGPAGEATASHRGSGWEELTFDFAGVSGNGTNAVTLIFDNGTSGAVATDPENWTFYFDDIMLRGDGIRK